MKIDVSNGELFDKVSILQIKMEKIKDAKKINNIKIEYDLLFPLIHSFDLVIIDNLQKLYYINLELWEVEDGIREKEIKKEFDDKFIELARSVYRLNDLRAAIKRDINISTDSVVIEEKSYVEWN